MRLFGSKKKEEIIAVIDIGSASVGGMLIKKSDCYNPEIIMTVRIPVIFLFDVDFSAFLRCSRDGLKKVICILLKKFPKGPDKILCVFSLLWGVSQTKIIKMRKNKSFKVEKDFFEELINNEIKNFNTSLVNKPIYFKKEPAFIEHHIMKSLLNGYYVKKIFGKTAKSLDVYVYMSAVIKDIKETAEKYFLEYFGGAPVFFRTRPFVIFAVLRNMINAEDGFIFADIGGDITEISLVRRNVLEETISFLRGKNFLIRKVASQFNTFIGDSVSLINSFRNKHASASVSKKISFIIEEAKKEWNGFFEKALIELSQEAPLPKHFFLLGDEDIIPEFKECAENEAFSKFTIFGKPFETKQISSDTFKRNFKFQRSFSEDKDIFLMAEGLFSDKFLI